ncbi:MAG: TIM-barrel domain-containing protein [Lachnospiraceae bacterium]
MIKKYSYGDPFKTDAVVETFPIEKEPLPYFCKDDRGSLHYTMGDKDIVYGLGENVRGINKRGWIYESKCSDDPHHEEHKRSLYAAHNFIVVKGKETFGFFADTPGKITFDIGYTRLNELTITPDDWNLELYVIEGKDVPDIIRQFRKAIGRSYIPPKWAFGFGQSRWGYRNEKDIRNVVKGYRENGIPLDMVYMDIDYMERFKDFTVDKEAFPDLTALAEELKAQGIRLIPIIDAGVKIEEGYDIYEEGVEKGYFCKEESGENFVAGVWPGRVHFPDFLNEDARHWFGKKYQFLLEQGIEGFWNDMNEPAIFYSEKHLEEVLRQIDAIKGKNLDIQSYFAFTGMIGSLSNNEKDYESFYHEFNGRKVRHDKVHNLYGYNMTRAAGEAFEKLVPDKRILLFSRSSYIGMHRYGGIWTGDNQSWWSHILLNLKMMPSLNMCGFLYTGADLGGFGADTTEDLVLRWLALGIFTPLMRNHAALGTREQEAYQFEHIEIFRNLIGIRYGLLPYLYSEYMKAALRDEMYFRPIAFAYPEDSFAETVEDQLLVGDSIMIAPVYTQNATGRYVYLPEEMKEIRMRSMEEMEENILPAGHHFVEIGLDEIVFFIRPDRIVPISEPASNVEELQEEELRFLSFVKTDAEYELYQDDGNGKDYENPNNIRIIRIKK